jgi:hypothetical protein
MGEQPFGPPFFFSSWVKFGQEEGKDNPLVERWLAGPTKRGGWTSIEGGRLILDRNKLVLSPPLCWSALTLVLHVWISHNLVLSVVWSNRQRNSTSFPSPTMADDATPAEEERPPSRRQAKRQRTTTGKCERIDWMMMFVVNGDRLTFNLRQVNAQETTDEVCCVCRGSSHSYSIEPKRRRRGRRG